MFKRSTALLLTLTLAGCFGGGGSSSSTPTSNRTASIAPIGAGTTVVATSHIQITFNPSTQGSLGPYETGGSTTTPQYLDTLLTNPASTFTFNVTVPSDATLYGTAVGTTVPYVGFIEYPTSSANSNADYLLGNATLPKMDQAGQTPQFADPAALYPVVVYAHGQGATPSDAQNQGEIAYLASHGFVVLTLFFADLRFPPAGTDFTQYQQFALRPLAVKTALDTLLTDPNFGGHVDPNRIAVVGMSYGGTTGYALQGGKILGPTYNQVRTTTTDSRIKAAVGIVPFLGNDAAPFCGWSNQGSTTLVRPFLAISGGADTTATLARATALMGNAPSALNHPKVVAIAGEGHGFSATALPDARTWELLFLQAKVLGDATAQATLDTLKNVSGGGDDSVAVE